MIKVFDNIERFQEVVNVWILLHILIPGNCRDRFSIFKKKVN